MLATALLAVAIGAGVGGALSWNHRGQVNLVRAAAASAAVQPADVRADGYVVTKPGARVALRAEVGGTVSKVAVVRGQRVHKGDLLLQFDRNQETAALQEAWAQAGEAQARLKARANDYKRSKELVASGALPKRELDDAASERKVATARLAAAGAAAKRIGASVEKTQVRAPIDGTIITRSAEPGESLAPSAPLFEIADLEGLRVEAEVDEYYLERVGVGNAVEVTAEAFVGQKWNGEIAEVGDAIVARKLRPLDPSRPGDVGVLQVWIALPPATPLKLGQRVQIRALAPAARPSNGLGVRE